MCIHKLSVGAPPHEEYRANVYILQMMKYYGLKL